MALEVSVLGLGWLMGGAIGLGTVLFTLTIGPSVQWGMRLFNFSATGEARPVPVRSAAGAPRGRRAA